MIEANMSQNVGRQVIGSLHQWDFGQSIKITGLDITGDTEVHFANEGSKTAIKMLGQYSREDASLKVEIPDVSLQSPRDICVFIYPTTENSGKTIRTGKIKMTARPKPEDYVQPETKDYLMCLLNEVEELISGGGSSVSDAQIEAAVEKYMEGHPFEEAGTAESKVSEHNTSEASHNDIRVLLQGLTNRLNALVDSDDTTLDQMSEVVAYIKNNKSLIDAITTSKVNVSDIIDNLTTNASNKPLSAAKGVTLKTMIDAIIVPTKLSELENDSGYAKTTDIPDKLPNPHKLTFSGAVTAEYDGSGAVTVTIPEGSGGSGGTARIEKSSTDTAVELEPNKLYIFPEMSELTITLTEPSDTGIENEYHFVFQSGATATTISISDTVKIPSGFAVEANKIYEVSIMENCLTYQSWAVA